LAIFKPPTRPKHSSEVDLFDALHTLDDHWRVYGSVIWQSKRNGRQGDGEIDFVLAHPAHGLIVVEVKGGIVGVDQGRWYRDTRGRVDTIKNPFEQITANKYALISFLKDRGLARVPVHHAVCLPHCSDDGQIGTYASPSIVWWSHDMRHVDAAVARTIRHWNARCRLSLDDMRRLDLLLAPTVQFKLRLADTIGSINDALLDLTDEQIRIFKSIQRNRRAIIRGGPGTGKTLLSIARAKKLAEEGFRPLWTCYNELLSKVVAAELLPYGIDATTFHALCMREATRAKLSLPRPLTHEFWTKGAAELLVEAAAKNGTTYDAIIVDEGQDFNQCWFDALETLSSDAKEPPVYVFADSQQRLYDRSWNLGNCLEQELERNCRNTTPIARRVTRIFSGADAAGGVAGPEPTYSELSNHRRILDRIEDRAAHLIEAEHLKPDQITVLVDDDDLARKLRERYAGPHPFCSHGQHGVVVETIARFKGLENDVIIVCLSKSTSSGDELRRNAYVGFSRAKAVLMVVADPKLKSSLNW
jgi:Nuclease-related domain/AAA domain